MSPTTGNGRSGWQLVISGATMQLLRDFREQAVETFVPAFRTVRRRLLHDPDVFGEPLYHLQGNPTEVRHAAVAPLVVAFALYPEQRAVWLFSAWLLSVPGPAN